MSTLPTRDNGYAIDPEAFATVAFFQAVFSSVHARLNSVETIAVDYDETIARLTTEALETVSATLSVEIADQRALLTGIQASAQAVLAAYDQISLTGVPATQIRVQPIGAFDPTNVQAAIAALAPRVAEAEIEIDTKLGAADADSRFFSKSEIDATRLRFDQAQNLTATERKNVRTTLALLSLRQAIGRNRFVDPGMQVSQQWGNSLLASPTMYPCDSWSVGYAGAPTLSSQRIVDAAGMMSWARLRVKTTSAVASLAANDVAVLSSPIEMVDLLDAGFGTLAAKRISIRVGMNFPAGTWPICIRSKDSTRSWVGTVIISPAEAGMPVKKSVQFDADMQGAWLANGNDPVYVSFTIGAGSTFVGVAGWQSGNKISVSGATNGCSISGAIFEIFEPQFFVGLDIGEECPPFYLESYPDALLKCQRYYEQFESYLITDVSGSNVVAVTEQLKTAKRVAPVCSFVAQNNAGNGGFYGRSATALSRGSVAVQAQAVNGCSSLGWSDVLVANARF